MKTLAAIAIGLGLAATSVVPAPVAPEWAQRLGWTLVHSVWQLAAVAVLAAIVDRLLARRSAQARYLAGVAALVVAAAAPCATWLLIHVSPGVDAVAMSPENSDWTAPDFSRLAATDNVATGDEHIAGDTFDVPTSAAIGTSGVAPRSAASPPRAFSWQTLDALSQSTLAAIRHIIEPRLLAITIGWLVGVAICAMRPLWGLWTQARLRRRGLSPVPEALQQSLARLAERLGIRRAVRGAESLLVKVPLVVGYLRPIILFPAGMVAGLTPAQLDALLAHELAHIRRHDWLVNALQVVVETLLFYHPAVWWLSRRIRHERENCCDDLAVWAVGDAAGYSRMLLTLAELRARVPEPAVAATGGTLLTRVQRLLRPPTHESSPQRGWLSGLVLLVVLGAISVGSINRHPQTEAADRTTEKPKPAPEPVVSEVVSPAVSANLPEPLRDLVTRIQEQEARLRNLDVTIEQVQVFRIGTAATGGFADTAELGPATPTIARSTGDIARIITQGDRFSYSAELTVSTEGADRKNLGKRLAVYDGADTVAIDEGNIATLFRGRHEPASMAPPHVWCLLASYAGIPLSTYLQGTDAIRAHPKAPFSSGGTFGFEIGQVECELTGEEVLGSLACITLKVQRRSRPTDPPTIDYLWLAKDRNYHVAQCKTAWMNRGTEVPGVVNRVTRWQEIAEGVWLPAAITSQKFPGPNEGNAKAEPTIAAQLFLKQAALNPVLPADTFRLPEIPQSLPKFVIGKDGTLQDGPLHPVPIAGARTTTLEAILQRLAVEEAKYDRYDVRTVEQYSHLNPRDLTTRGGVTAATEAHERSVVAGARLFNLKERGIQSGGSPRTTTTVRAFDGRWTRGLFVVGGDGGEPAQKPSAELALDGGETVSVLRPGAMVFHGQTTPVGSLERLLRSDWYDRRQGSSLNVEYAGDERIGDLYCHRVKCQISHDRGRTFALGFSIWLARDRNLIAVRHEWREPRKAKILPTGITYVDDLREVKPGLWFPHRTTSLAFQQHNRDGLPSGRPLVQWRWEMRVESLALDFQVPDALFAQLTVSKGTKIFVHDRRWGFRKEFAQPADGNIEIGPEQLELERRSLAAEARIGKPAPDLPREGWVTPTAPAWKDMAGKIVLVSFCESAPRLKQLTQWGRSPEIVNSGVAIVAVHAPGSDREALVKALGDTKLPLSVLIDSPQAGKPAATGALFESFSVPQLPATYLVDGTGKIVDCGEEDQILVEALRLARKAAAGNE